MALCELLCFLEVAFLVLVDALDAAENLVEVVSGDVQITDLRRQVDRHGVPSTAAALVTGSGLLDVLASFSRGVSQPVVAVVPDGFAQVAGAPVVRSKSLGKVVAELLQVRLDASAHQSHTILFTGVQLLRVPLNAGHTGVIGTKRRNDLRHTDGSAVLGVRADDRVAVGVELAVAALRLCHGCQHALDVDAADDVAGRAHAADGDGRAGLRVADGDYGVSACGCRVKVDVSLPHRHFRVLWLGSGLYSLLGLAEVLPLVDFSLVILDLSVQVRRGIFEFFLVDVQIALQGHQAVEGIRVKHLVRATFDPVKLGLCNCHLLANSRNCIDQ